jgi:hypothetical protein
MENYYKHSGRTPVLGIVSGFLAGVLISIPASYLYDYGIIEITTDKLRFICTLLFGALIGAGAGLGLVWGKVRNTLAAALLGAAACLAGLYISWGVWIYDVSGRGQWFPNPSTLLMHPKAMWQVILKINTTGTWAMEHDAPTAGTMLWVVWLTEALLIVGFGTLVTVALMKRQPFCEKCDGWCSKTEKLYFAPTLPPVDVKTKLESHQFECLQRLGQGSARGSHFRVILHSCSSCGMLNTLSLIKAFPKDQKTLIDKLLLSSAEIEAVRRLGSSRSAAAVAIR